MVGRDVEQHRNFGGQLCRALQLEAGQFQDVDIGRIVVEEIKRRLAEIAACKHRATVCFAHVVKQRRHRTFAVRARDRNKGLPGIAREQLDVRDNFELLLTRLFEQRMAVRNAGRRDDARDIFRQRVLTELDFSVGPDVIEFVETGRRLTTVEEYGVDVIALQVTRDRQAGGAEAHDQILVTCGLRGAHRIFRLARPISTRMTVIIQNRTMTLGSAQPLSSK